RIPLSKALELVLESIAGDTSEVEDLSDIDDPIEDVNYYPPQQEPSRSEEKSSGDEDPTSQSTVASQGRKCLCGETCCCPEHGNAISHTPRHRTQWVDGSNNDPKKPTPGLSFQGQPKQGRGVRWRAAQLTPNLAQFEPEKETEQDR
ncbi:hypothetical protein HF521_004742, partial [Silurus meridionalis]